MAVLTQKELEEAIREWAKNRGLPVTDNNEVVLKARWVAGSGSTEPDSTSTNYSFQAQIHDLDLPPQNGPYR